jgi:hypothetical protein
MMNGRTAVTAARTLAVPSGPRGGQGRPTPATIGRSEARTTDPSMPAPLGSVWLADCGHRPSSSTGPLSATKPGQGSPGCGDQRFPRPLTLVRFRWWCSHVGSRSIAPCRMSSRRSFVARTSALVRAGNGGTSAWPRASSPVLQRGVLAAVGLEDWAVIDPVSRNRSPSSSNKATPQSRVSTRLST